MQHFELLISILETVGNDVQTGNRIPKMQLSISHHLSNPFYDHLRKKMLKPRSVS
jgi:hypothetical protein